MPEMLRVVVMMLMRSPRNADLHGMTCKPTHRDALIIRLVSLGESGHQSVCMKRLTTGHSLASNSTVEGRDVHELPPVFSHRGVCV